MFGILVCIKSICLYSACVCPFFQKGYKSRASPQAFTVTQWLFLWAPPGVADLFWTSRVACVVSCLSRGRDHDCETMS